ncbi:MAG: hypothetical protein BYD32DRAFT_441061 [Podila humilis]|nr:MAG: hypothetical protein BYD32DRAFT_441061 [Podila humilis]
MNYLSAGDIPLPKIYGASAIVYFAAGATWASILMKKDLILAIMIGIQKPFQTTRSEAERWTVMFYIFAFIKGSLSILIITLIASGWIFIKPFLNEKDKKIILIIIPLQILTNVAMTISEETAVASPNWAFWGVTLTMGFLVVNCVVVAENKIKYKLWGAFYIVTVVYVYFTRIMIQFIKVSLPYQYVNWLVELLNESITLGFYVTIELVFLTMRPFARVGWIKFLTCPRFLVNS